MGGVWMQTRRRDSTCRGAKIRQCISRRPEQKEKR
ncbi:hypothetical protein FHR33_000902 [Nonomuraea dietziae]|uniref:Uncharacterized protein n=1 Tax=Nonomuraea dietziae TaxID=65515 RepID=A0A7W5VCC9_9ACTN|nr:hypothetical protein [Nonomuraea dietziae]